MKVPNTATITESLQNCSLNHESGAEEGKTRRSSTSDDNNGTVSGTSLELNSHVSLPYNWEHRLYLKTEESYGAKETEDLRTAAEYGGEFYSDEDKDDSWNDSDESSSSASSSRDYNNNNNNKPGAEEENDDVLVVGGCKNCYMYFMVPKKAQGCPKCNAQLLRFDRPQISSPSP